MKSAKTTKHAVDLAILPSMSFSELCKVWARHFSQSKPPSQRRLLVREIAWRLQEKQRGGFDPLTKRLLDAAMRSVQSRAQPEEQRGRERRLGTKSVIRRHESPIQLKQGTRLLRKWRGVTYEVVVLERGFRFREREFASLSQIAMAITGTHWSGPRFFGLRRRSRAA
ncbi:MAG: DUF2924 domain-containing protein [Phycisphaeraceae bacterium]|nr:DUF2924 domain-containing protein [Phycisphaeraceae bacterium]